MLFRSTETGEKNNKKYVLSFNEVLNTNSYAVYVFYGSDKVQEAIDSGFENVSPTESFSWMTSYDVTKYMNRTGEYFFSVQALYSKIPSFSSDPSDPLECSHSVYYYLDTPVISVDQQTYQCSWDTISSASGYELDIRRADTQTSILSDVIKVTGSEYVLAGDVLDLMNAENTTHFNVMVRAVGHSEDKYIIASDWASAQAMTYKTIETPNIEYQYSIVNEVETHKIVWQSLEFVEYFEL